MTIVPRPTSSREINAGTQSASNILTDLPPQPNFHLFKDRMFKINNLVVCCMFTLLLGFVSAVPCPLGKGKFLTLTPKPYCNGANPKPQVQYPLLGGSMEASQQVQRHRAWLGSVQSQFNGTKALGNFCCFNTWQSEDFLPHSPLFFVRIPCDPSQGTSDAGREHGWSLPVSLLLLVTKVRHGPNSTVRRIIPRGSD